MFSDSNVDSGLSQSSMDHLILGAAFHYNSFPSYFEAKEWVNQSLPAEWNDSFYQFSSKAKHPFQFMSTYLSLMAPPQQSDLTNIPITQDASASAYQIMSYFLLDEKIASRTNLFPVKGDQDEINDIYSYILEELKEFIYLDIKIDEDLTNIIVDKLDRQIVKGIFMPMIYGKTLLSTAGDLYDKLSQFITKKECFLLASSCFSFWKTQYSNMDCLIRLIKNIGWVVSKTDRPVQYHVSYFKTVQDYMKIVPVSIMVNDFQNNKKKKRKVTLRVSSNKRDRRKTETSTFVNFIHQRDAYLAMKVVEVMLNSLNAPIYTVHDNFISSSKVSHYLPYIYNTVFSQMEPPLTIINKFIYMNLVEPMNSKDLANIIVEKGGSHQCCVYDDFERVVIDRERLSKYLDWNRYLAYDKPMKMNHKDQKVWDDRVNTILNCYEKYTTLVCGKANEKDFADHMKMYEKFIKKVNPYNENLYEYHNKSLHY